MCVTGDLSIFKNTHVLPGHDRQGQAPLLENVLNVNPCLRLCSFQWLGRHLSQTRLKNTWTVLTEQEILPWSHLCPSSKHQRTAPFFANKTKIPQTERCKQSRVYTNTCLIQCGNYTTLQSSHVGKLNVNGRFGKSLLFSPYLKKELCDEEGMPGVNWEGLHPLRSAPPSLEESGKHRTGLWVWPMTKQSEKALYQPRRDNFIRWHKWQGQLKFSI